MSQSIKVDIYGQMYPINAELDEAYVRKIAAYVDEKMRLISDAAKTVDTQKVAVLAALAIADELNVEANIAAGKAGGLPAELHKKLRAHRWDRNPTTWSQ